MQSARSSAPDVISSTKPALASVLKLTAPVYAEANCLTFNDKSGDEPVGLQVAPSEEPCSSKTAWFQGQISSSIFNTRLSSWR